MELYKQIEKEAGDILSEFCASGLSLALTAHSTLRITGTATQSQIAACRQYKTQIIETLSPHCSNCTLPMELINDGALWFCPFGCESREKEK